jgi:hypothetical protein
MDKKEYQEYISRWKLVGEVEAREIKTASFELLFQQTLSIWDIGRSLGFSTHDTPSNPLWPKLQLKWKELHA